MIKKLLPILLALVGTGAGVGAGLFLMPAGEDHADATECLPPDDAVRHETVAAAPDDPDQPDATREYVKLSNQFVVPIMGSERVRALVVASLSVEVSIGSAETVYAREPKLRDVFLQVMFDHANIGGFEGAFTTGERMKILRGALLDAARSVLGSDVSDVLITEIARQEA
ncbi:flagellar basal body-associated FliL family protein [Ponticoccus alexandrii]|uniref:Flagellar protein FliL n=1 Tax=Ponticoccus alexandrii TaxID=1943633 RepID=A0ABX7FFX1_9RHOB|nr:flagellar basal body-associated FliL family protein [Ponticoccus alexandrii]ETA52725.1 flagellar basal body-associated protein FliL [Rhodobacteraceae bacterium PD-2]QRF68307.1 flagellar basal body-associated protein FliL [Ponticoccus alexandrii]